MMKWKVLILHFLALFSWQCNGQTLSNYKQLHTDVFANHNAAIIPKVDASTPLEIRMMFFMISLSKFDEVEETLVITAGIGASWNDAGISWTPSSYGGVTHLTIPKSSIWSPPVTLLNSAEELEPYGNEQSTATVFYDGNVTMSQGSIFKSKCTADIYKFPFDTQKCTLEIVVWGYGLNNIVLTENTVPISTVFFTPNSNWYMEAIDSAAVSNNGFSQFEIYLTIKREALYFGILMLGPNILFSILNPLVFLLPVESGERVGLAMTMLLSYVLFVTILAQEIPASSNPMSSLIVILIVAVAISSMIVLMTIINSLLYYRDENKKMNEFWIFIGTRFPWCKKNQVRPYPENCNEKIRIKPYAENLSPQPENEKPYLEKEKTHTENEKNNNSSKWFANELESPVSWKDVSASLDILFLIFSYSSLILVLLSFFGIVS